MSFGSLADLHSPAGYEPKDLAQEDNPVQVKPGFDEKWWADSVECYSWKPKKSFTRTIPLNLAKLVKIYPGIIVRQHLAVQKQNAVAERAVRRIKEGTSAVLLQSGLDEKWWADSMAISCFLRNIQDLLSYGKTRYERRFGEPFKGPMIPFGAMVEYHPISDEDLSRLHQFGPKV